MNDNIKDVFFALIRGGLWEQSVELSSFSPFNADALYQLADEQSVVGLIAAGFEHVVDIKVTKQQALPFLKHIFSIENSNTEKNYFISWLWKRLKEERIDVVLVKGQGVAQCYERPQWRSSGDIDLLLNADNYEKAKDVLSPIAQTIHTEKQTVKHLGLTIQNVTVELHGTFHTGLSRKLDSILDVVQDEMFTNRLLRDWENNHTFISLPSPDCDVIFVFSHILQHLYKGGIGLRQICDLCRLLWTYSKDIDPYLLSSRLHEMGIRKEWDAFMAFAVDYLGLPKECALFYTEPKPKQSRRIASFIMETGNFGRSRDNSYREKDSPVIFRKCITLWRQVQDNIRLSRISSRNAIRFTFGFVLSQIDN